MLLAGSQSWANNGTANLSISGSVTGSGSPTLTNNGTGSGVLQFGGPIASSVTKLVQNSATSNLALRNPANSFANLEIKKGTVEMGNGGTVLGTGAVTLG